MARCFIVDPVCARRFGHNINALGYFKTIASKYWDNVQTFACYHLPTSPGDDNRDIELFFDFYFGKYMDVERRPKWNDNSATGDAQLPSIDLATYDYSNFLFYYGVTSDDAIILPSADYFSVAAICNALDEIPDRLRPTLLIRFIGVLEYITDTERDGVEKCFDSLRAYAAGGGKVRQGCLVLNDTLLFQGRLGYRERRAIWRS